jgi:hypothetical protein
MRSHLQITVFSLIFLCIPQFLFAGVYVPVIIPENEQDAYRKQVQGILDSATFALLQPLYEQPVSVPLGELNQLASLFPDLDLPAGFELLRNYEPWTTETIERFFHDYPFLVPLKPILSFETKRKPVLGSVSFTLKMADYSRIPYNAVKIVAAPGKFLRFDATAAFGDTLVEWRRRVLSLRHRLSGELEIGNFTHGTDGGVFYGYFPQNSRPSMTSGFRFLYGQNSGWNGIRYSIQPSRAVDLEGFFHGRQEEVIGGFGVALSPGSLVSVTGGVSGLIMHPDTQGTDTFAFVHAGVSLRAGGAFTARCETGVTLLHKVTAPVFLSVVRTIENGTQAVSWFLIPRGFFAPRSQLLHASYTTLSSPYSSDSITPYRVSGISVSAARRFSDYFGERSELAYYTSQSAASCCLSLRAYGQKPFIYVLSYSMNRKTAPDRLNQRIEASGTYPLARFLSIGADGGLALGMNKRPILEATLRSEISEFSGMYWEPYCMYSTDGDTLHGAVAGIKQRIALFEKTFTECSVKIPLKKNFDGGFFLNAKLCFVW